MFLGLTLREAELQGAYFPPSLLYLTSNSRHVVSGYFIHAVLPTCDAQILGLPACPASTLVCILHLLLRRRADEPIPRGRDGARPWRARKRRLEAATELAIAIGVWVGLVGRGRKREAQAEANA